MLEEILQVCYINYNMASFDLKVDKNTKPNSLRTKIWGVGLIVLSCAVLCLLIFNIVPFVQNFLMGVLGVFAYPFALAWFCVGLALISDKHYFLPIKYLIYLLICVLCVLALVNLLILGSPPCSITEYLALTYQYKYTAGGLLVGVLLAPLLAVLGTVGTAIIFAVVLVVFVALTVDFLNSIKKYGFKKVVLKKHQPRKVLQVEKNRRGKNELAEVQAKPEFNLFLDKELEEQENRNALLKLGLIEGNLESAKAPVEKKKTLKERLLTPLPFDEVYFRPHINEQKSTPVAVQKQIEQLKREPVAQKTIQQFTAEPVAQKQFDDAEEDVIEPYQMPTIPEDLPVPSVPEYQQTQSNYEFPPISLLDEVEADLSSLNEDVVGKRALLEETLETFGINAKVKNVVVGPSVTRYELEMPHGVSVKRILSLEDDISLAMASRAGVRIEAPIPGKSAVGIEVPNESVATVTLREVLETDVFKTNRSPVTFALGKNLSGGTELCNLAKMPHILVAGATNSGKSICLNAIIISMVYKSGPDDLRLILIDPKRVEFSLYNGLPHLLLPNVITEVDKAVSALLWCVNEMERRFELLAMARCRNSEEYNKTQDVQNGTAPKMPYIVVIVDELADLMSSGKKELEEYLRRLTQKARAAGILLVLATQRPSVDVITGVIKTNCPARISFALTSNVDSRTILDASGAESLLGRGDMLYKPSDVSSPRRVQGCFVSADEVERVVEYIKAHNASNFDENTEKEITKPAVNYNPNQIEGNIGDPKWDPLLPQALKMFIENGQASTSAIQRRFLAGFPRASRIVDQLCQMGYLSQPDGTKPRTVLITMQEFYEKFGADFE